MKLKIGTFITIFKAQWEKDYQPLLQMGFDYFELLPENAKAYSRTALRKYLGDKEIILHAPFIEANLIAQSQVFQNASIKFYSDVLKPLVEDYQPEVITTHLGRRSFLQNRISPDPFIQLSSLFPAITFENQPYRPNLWRQSYPGTEEEVDYVLGQVKAKMTFDVGHWIVGGFDVYRLLEKYLPRIADIHIHDVVDGKDHQALGTGILDVEKFISILNRKRYKGYLTIELVPSDIKGVISSYKMLKEYLH